MPPLVQFLNSDAGSIITSALMGVGLASIFRRTCGEHCVIVHAPNTTALKKNLYMIDGVCYKYTPKAVVCSTSSFTPPSPSAARASQNASRLPPV